MALAGRAKVDIKLDDLDAIAREVPLLANIRPSGKYLMEDFYYAGGIRALMARLSHLLEGDAPTVSGKTLAENIAGAEVYEDDVIRPLDNPVSDQQTLAVLRGNLAPTGAVLKPIAADTKLLVHTGPAVVFEDYNDMNARIDLDDLDVTADSVLILRNSGPQGGPGMPEWGMLPIPKKLLRQGVSDMVRLSDARMSGTSYGTCVLHVSPESFVGGPLALVRTGDMIRLDVPARRLDLLLDDDEMAARKAAWTAPKPRYGRGFGAIYAQHVTQADEGCDFAILRDGEPVPEPEIH
jgi:dihydroxy-acid dehydratase